MTQEGQFVIEQPTATRKGQVLAKQSSLLSISQLVTGVSPVGEKIQWGQFRSERPALNSQSASGASPEGTTIQRGHKVAISQIFL
jgi:hypothetical protein